MSSEQDRFKRMVENSPDWFWEFDEHANFTYASPSIRTLLGYEPEELIGLNAFDLMEAEEAERVRRHFDPIAKKYLPFSHLVNRNLHKDGHEVIIESSGTPIFDEDGQFRGYRGIDRDITERKLAEDALRKSDTLFRVFFASNPIASVISSPSGVIHMVNPAFLEKSGFSADEVLGRTSQEVGFWCDPAERDRMLAAITEHGFVDDMEASFYHKDGRKLTCLVSSRAIEHENELRVLSTLFDITTQKQAERALQKLARAKSDFISTAAHELRTPLVAIMGYAELLENTAHLSISAQEQQSYAAIIRSNAEILTRLTDDLLDVEQIQLDRPFRFTREEASLEKLIKKVLASTALKCPDFNFTLTHVDTLPEIMWIDSVRITQVLNNLLDNAVKYSPESRTVEVATETDENQVKISIKDYGIGMTSEEIEQVFERFYRAKTTMVTQGLGLGMCIVKRIVEEHGGEVCIASRPGEGTAVTFTLPIQKAADSEHGA